MTTKEQLLGYIFDYASHHRLLDVIQAISESQDGYGDCTSLGERHVRMASVALYKIVFHEITEDFPVAISLLQQLFKVVTWSSKKLVKSYVKMICGLKIKLLFYYLQKMSKIDLWKLLNEYFPRDAADVDLAWPGLFSKLKEATAAFRKSFLPLILHERKREKFMMTQYEALYGTAFSTSLTSHITKFLDEIEKDLPQTFIDELLQEPADKRKCNSSSDLLMEILLDSMKEKITLQTKDLLDLLELINPHEESQINFQHSLFAFSQDSQEINNSGPLAKGVPSSLPESGVPIEMVSAPNTSQDDSLSRCKFDLQVHYITSSSGSDSNCTCSCPESTQQSAKPDKEKDCSSNENEVCSRHNTEKSETDNDQQKNRLMDFIPSSYGHDSETEGNSGVWETSDQRKVLCPNLKSLCKNNKYPLCVVKLHRNEEIDYLDPASGILSKLFS